MSRNEGGEPFTKTPLVKRLPTTGCLLLAFILAKVLGHVLWSGLVIFVVTFAVCMLILRYAFGQPLDRLLGFKEFPDN
jgi:hypothetical protein